MSVALVDLVFPLILAIALAMARIGGIVMILPVFTRMGISGILRGGVTFALSLPMVPYMLAAFGRTPPDTLTLTALMIKEVFVGLMLGVLYAIPFWGVETAGNIIDQQRGAFSTFEGDPSGMEQSSVIGTMLVLALIALFLIGGGFDVVLGGLYDSYRIWPAERLLPPITGEGAVLVLGLLDKVLRLGVLVAAPIVIAMFLGDLALGFVNRFAQQLNVFNIGFAVKSLIMAVLLPLYAILMVPQFGQILAPLKTALAEMEAYLK